MQFAVSLSCTLLWSHSTTTATATTILQPFFRDHPSEPVPEENFWTLWCKGRLTEADTPTIRLGTTPNGVTSAHLHHPHFLQAGCPSCRPTNSVKVLKATSAFGLGRRHQSSPQRHYLYRLRTVKSQQSITKYAPNGSSQKCSWNRHMVSQLDPGQWWWNTCV